MVTWLINFQINILISDGGGGGCIDVDNDRSHDRIVSGH